MNYDEKSETVTTPFYYATFGHDRFHFVKAGVRDFTGAAYIDLTDELSSIGGGLLRNFSVTFDQKRNQVTLFRPTYDPIQVAPVRSTGLSFTKTTAYWRVAAVVDGSPAEQLGVSAGDLCTRISDEPVSAWAVTTCTRTWQEA